VSVVGMPVVVPVITGGNVPRALSGHHNSDYLAPGEDSGFEDSRIGELEDSRIRGFAIRDSGLAIRD